MTLEKLSLQYALRTIGSNGLNGSRAHYDMWREERLGLYKTYGVL